MTISHTYVIAHCLDCSFRNPFAFRRDAEQWAREHSDTHQHTLTLETETTEHE